MKSNYDLSLPEYAFGVTVYSPDKEPNLGTAVIYFHGGGLLYGERDDLPAAYIEKFLQAGFTLLCLDYPLAPETSLHNILTFAVSEVKQLTMEVFPKLAIHKYFLFGRSAGSYLCLLLTRMLKAEVCPQPAGILDFYGFYSLSEPFVCEPSAYYLKLPLVSKTQVKNIIQAGIVTSGPKSRRYSLYIYARQTGHWIDLLGASPADEMLSLSEQDFISLPPLFITASSTDPDVPFKISKALSRKAPKVVFKPVYNLEHDFDRDYHSPVARNIYDDCINWLLELCAEDS